jgi:hypothetical protein
MAAFTISFLLIAVLSLGQESAGQLAASVKNAFLNHFNQVRSQEASAEHVSNMWQVVRTHLLSNILHPSKR